MKIRAPRRFLAAFGVVAILGVAAIPASSATTVTAKVATANTTLVGPDPTVVGTAKSGGNLNILELGLSWISLDPDTPNLGPILYPPLSFVYEGLFNTTPSGVVVPQLASGYTYSANHLALTIHLRKGVKFQDGTPFNSAAVVFDLNRIASVQQNSACSAYFTSVSSIQASGAYNVVVNFSTPYAAMIAELAGNVCGLMPSPTAIQSEGASYGSHPVGTGPYTFTSEVINSSISFTRWNGYWQKSHKALFATATVTSTESDQSAIDAVETGAAQAFYGANTQDAASVRGVKSVKAETGNGYDIENIRLNTTKAPFNQQWARTAVAEAINTTQIVKQLYSNRVKADQTYVTPSCFCFTGYSEPGYPAYSAAKAAALVQSNGGLSFTLSVENVPSEVQLAEAIEAQLQAANIQVTVSPLAEVTLIANSHIFAYQGELTGTPVGADPDTAYYHNFFSQSTTDQTGIKNSTLDSLMVQARETTNQANRKRLYARAQSLLTGSNGLLPVIPLFVRGNVIIISKKLQNFPPYANSQINTLTSWLS